MACSCGIDPGRNGGIAVIDDNFGKRQLVCWPMPEDDLGIIDLIKSIQKLYNPVWFIEQAHARPGNGVASTFKFGYHYGYLIAIMDVLGIKYHVVSPQKWHSILQCISHGDKCITRGLAQDKYPEVKITNKTAEAVLIAEYGMVILNENRGKD